MATGETQSATTGRTVLLCFRTSGWNLYRDRRGNRVQEAVSNPVAWMCRPEAG